MKTKMAPAKTTSCTRMSFSVVRMLALVAIVAFVQFESARSASTSQQPIFRENNRDNGAPAAYGTTEASERLMKELKEIFKSDGYKNGVFSVELENGDNLYEWNVKLFILDSGQLHEDLQQLKKDSKEEDHIMLRMSFGDNYPNEPPFVRVIYPILDGPFMMKSGVICMDILTKQGWVRAYDAQTLILSIADLLAGGQTEVDCSKGSRDIRERYTAELAKKGFEDVENAHNS